MTVDVSTFVGPYPFRPVPDATPDGLLRAMDRLAIATAWVGHLPSVFYRDPRPGTADLLKLLAPHADRLVPVPTVHPGLPAWPADLRVAVDSGAPAVRVYPGHQGLHPAGGEMRDLLDAAAAAGLAVVLTVKLEDVRQRHPLDTAPDLSAAAVRALARHAAGARLLVTHADRTLVEEVHFGLTPDEARRVLWEISWIWGPPEDHLALLLETVGPDRFTFGTGMPLRLPEGAVAKLDLLDLPPDRRAGLSGANLQRWRE
jgi:predicted TIM-barrel fold metal-dependent hydrolase